jgi:hypothetical protein
MAKKDDRLEKAEPSRSDVVHPAATSMPHFSSHRLREMAAAGLGEANAMQHRLSQWMRTSEESYDDPRLRPTPHVIDVHGVTAGLGLEYADEQRVQLLVASSVPDFSAKTQTQRIMLARGRVVSTLRDSMKFVDADTRDEIVRRAMSYWKRTHQTAYDKEPTIRYRGPETRKAMPAEPLLVIPVSTLVPGAELSKAGPRAHKYLSRRADGKGGYVYNYGEAHEHGEGHGTIELPKKGAFHIGIGPKGETKEERSGHHFGDFAVHKDGTTHLITHKPTGLKVGESKHSGEALGLAHHMSQHANGVSAEDAMNAGSEGNKKLREAKKAYRHEIVDKKASDQTRVGIEGREAEQEKGRSQGEYENAKRHDDRMDNKGAESLHHKVAARFKDKYGHWPTDYDEDTNPRLRRQKSTSYHELASDRLDAAKKHLDSQHRGGWKNWEKKHASPGGVAVGEAHGHIDEAKQALRHGFYDKADAATKRAHEAIDKYESHHPDALPKTFEHTDKAQAREKGQHAENWLREASERRKGAMDSKSRAGTYAGEIAGDKHLNAAQNALREGHEHLQAGDHSKAGFKYGTAMEHIAEHDKIHAPNWENLWHKRSSGLAARKREHDAHNYPNRGESDMFRSHGASAEDLNKAGGKYYRRVPTGDPKHPYRYYYTEASYKNAHGGSAHVHGPEESESSAHLKAKAHVANGTNVVDRMTPEQVHLAARGAMKAKDYKTANALASHVTRALAHGHKHMGQADSDKYLRSAWHKLNPGSDKSELNESIDRERGARSNVHSWGSDDTEENLKAKPGGYGPTVEAAGKRYDERKNASTKARAATEAASKTRYEHDKGAYHAAHSAAAKAHEEASIAHADEASRWTDEDRYEQHAKKAREHSKQASMHRKAADEVEERYHIQKSVVSDRFSHLVKSNVKLVARRS